jgi:hypothetical protein
MACDNDMRYAHTLQLCFPNEKRTVCDWCARRAAALLWRPDAAQISSNVVLVIHYGLFENRFAHTATQRVSF